jgi:tRNA (cmo5U34)-methyltransferase
MSEDDIYAAQQDRVQDFRFDSKVTRVFADMIRRSVPGYGLTLQMISVIAAKYAQEGSILYDLGCSLGASTLAMRHGIQAKDCQIIGVDNSQDMLQQCEQYIDADDGGIPVHLYCEDIQHVTIKNASVVVLNFTLQFIPVDERESLLSAIYQGLRDGGVLVLSEKVCFDHQGKQTCLTELHEAFKASQGYSDLEISQKRQALENVLLAESLETHHQRLKQAGFTHSQTWFQCFNFASMLAFK